MPTAPKNPFYARRNSASSLPSRPPRFQVAIGNRQRTYPLDAVQVRAWTEQILTMQRCTPVEVSILFVNDRAIRRLNRDYRRKDRPTNVLAFAMRDGEGKPPDVAEGPEHLGDVVISLETTAREASVYGRRTEEHLLILLIHGLLHLLGYDHERSDIERRQMERRERRLFRVLWAVDTPDVRRGVVMSIELRSRSGVLSHTKSGVACDDNRRPGDNAKDVLGGHN